MNKSPRQALYRKYRSHTFDEVIGQGHVTSILAAAVQQGKISHAYLLTGPRGVGKTSVARILAHAITKLPYTGEDQPLDIIEIDAASNNGIDDIRDLRDKARVAPAHAARKVYIIDEVHMLSKAAFNGLLKILEEPPAHVVFILATTDYDKLPATIISRTQRFHFRLVEAPIVAQHLAHIAAQEGITADKEALMTIAERGGGSLRDSISLFDQLQSGHQHITAQLVDDVLGLAPRQRIDELTTAIAARQPALVVRHVSELVATGISPATLASQLAAAVRARIADEPWLITTLEGLAHTPQSTQPEVALLVALLGPMEQQPPRPDTAPAHQPSPAPHTTPPATPAPMAPHTPQPSTTQVNAPAKPTASIPSTPAPAPSAKQPTNTPHPARLADFDQAAWLEAARQASLGLYSILSACTVRTDGDTLTIYTGKAFTQHKLESTRFRPLLAKITADLVGEAQIVIIGTPPPPTDSTAARVAEFMGGGEEVDVNE